MTKQSPLGKNINFPKAFSTDLLHPISRAEQRDNMPSASFNGYDMWNIFELLWIDQKHFLHQNQISIKINCNSEFIPESKSMKLFLGSLIYKTFENETQLYQLIKSTLNDVLNTSVEIYDDIYEDPENEILYEKSELEDKGWILDNTVYEIIGGVELN